jgi:antitoxin component HigA of HigAB toxin-antitoxin module
MKRLKKIIDEYGRWSDIVIYMDRIEAHVKTDFSHAIENAKALLETIGKEICNSNGLDCKDATSLNVVLKRAFMSLGYKGTDMVNQISSALGTIGQQIGDLRNEIGSSSHGKTLDELKERNNKVDELTKELLIDTTVIVASFLIRNFENNNPRIDKKKIETKLLYSDSEQFNDFWDEMYGEFVMGDYSFPASEILFNVDFQAYETELKIFIEEE